MATQTDRRAAARSSHRWTMAVSFALGTVIFAAAESGPVTAWASLPVALQAHDLKQPIIFPEPTPVGGGTSAPTGGGTSAPTGGGSIVAPSNASGATNTWRIADTGGIPARVRSAPSLDSTVVMRLEPGTVVEPMNETVNADGYQWRRISFDGATGWIAMTLLLEPAAPPPQNQVYMVAAVGERGLNVREGPSTGTAVIGSLREGTVVTVVSGPREAEGRQWLQVRSDGANGWVIAEAITTR